jgi:hypothetical protein
MFETSGAKNVGFNHSLCFLNKFDVESIGAHFGGTCRDDTVIAVALCPNTNALHSGDSCTWLERLFELENGFLVCLIFHLHVGLGQ